MTRDQSANSWLLGATVVLAGSLVVFAGLVAGGLIEVRTVARDGVADGSEVEAADEPRIRAVPQAVEFIELMGDEAYAYEFEGAWVDCWIEVEIDGETTRLGEGTGEQTRILLEARDEPYEDPPRGYVLWVASRDGDRETWTIAAAVVNADGEVLAQSSTRGIDIPLPRSGTNDAGSTQTSTGTALLTGDEPITLVTKRSLRNGDESLEERTTRKVRLVCRPVSTSSPDPDDEP